MNSCLFTNIFFVFTHFLSFFLPLQNIICEFLLQANLNFEINLALQILNC